MYQKVKDSNIISFQEGLMCCEDTKMGCCSSNISVTRFLHHMVLPFLIDRKQRIITQLTCHSCKLHKMK